MNALTKRLLSFLVVMTMVIGMVPAVGLPAVVAKADTALTINEQASAMTFTGGTDNLYCPVCDAPVDWVPLTDGGAIATPAKSTHVHYYVYGSSVNVTATSAKSGSTTLGVIANLANSGSKICLNLNGHNLVAPCGFRLGSSSVALNIMGEGAMTYTDTGFDSYSRNKGLFYIENGAVNLYGGTYYDTKPANTKPLVQGYTQNRVTLSVYEGAKLFGAAIIPMLWKINVSGDSFIQNLQITDTAVQSGAAITIAEDFTGNIWNVSFPGGIAEDGTIATGKVTSFTGNITTADGKKIEAVDGALKTTTAITTPTETAFEPDTHNGNAWCEHCEDFVDWVPYFGNNTIVLQDSSDVYHFHIYLTEDVNYTGTITNGNFMHSFENICLNLNGYDVSGVDANGNTVGKRAMRVTQTLAIMGDGSITAGKTNSGDGAVAKDMTEFYLYGGANLATVASDSSPVITCKGNIYLNGGSITGFVSDKSAAATISLANGASADLIKMTNAASKLSVAAGWSGEAVVQLPVDLVDGAVPAANGVALGAYTGKLTTSDGVRLFNVDGSLSSNIVFDPTAETNFCEACNDYVAWTALPATEEGMDLSTGKHYYVPQDMTFTGSAGWLFKMPSRAVLCLHLNGKTLSLNNTRIYNGAAGSTVNIIGAGGTLTSTHSKGLFYSDTGNTHLYGGTYVASGTKGIEIGSANGQYHFHGDAELEGMITLAKGKVHLYDQAVVEKIVLSGTGKLTIKDGWTGSAVLDIDSALITNNTVSTDNAVVEGTYAGTLTTVDGFEVSVVDRALLVAQPTADTFDPWNYAGKAYCQVCGSVVDWVDYNAHVAENGYYDNNNKLNASGVPTQHYYLSDDITYTTQCFSTNDILHFNFNGCDVTATGDEATSAFRFTQKAHFFNTGDVATVTGGIADGAGAALENAGNVTKDNESDTWIYGNIVLTKLSGGTAPVVNMGGELNQLTLIGNPVIQGVDGQGLVLGATGTLIDVSGLTEGASIAMSGLTVGEAFTLACDNAETVKGYFSCADTALPVSVLDDQLILIAAAGIVTGDTTVWYADNAAAVNAYTEQNFADGAYIELKENESALVLLGGNYYVNIGGKDIAVSGSGTLYPIDTANDTYQFFGMWTYEGVDVVRDVTVGGKRYITVTDGDTSTHRLDMAINGVNIRTDAAGLYYDAKYLCDSTLAGMVSKYGVILSLRDMPGAVLDSTDKRTELTGLEPGATATSGSVSNIFSTARTAAKNAQYGKMDIYANAYIELDVDGDGNADVLVADNENVGKTAGTAWSLYDALAEMDQNWSDYAEEDRDAVKVFYTTWADYGLSDYGFTNINDLPDVNAGGSEGGATSEDDDLTTEL